MFQLIEITESEVPSNNENLSMIESIQKVDDNLTYEEFFKNYLIKNQPCIFNSTVTSGWPCRNLWVSGDAPNFEYLTKMFGKWHSMLLTNKNKPVKCRTMVPVYDCQAKYYNSQFKKKMKMEDFMEYWVKYKEKDYIADMPLLYLKDWHCSQEFKHVKFYEVPYYFASDWLNEYFIAKQELNDDYMFVYMGPKGTWTPLHKDVFQSYSWSANIVGRKRWLFIPPKEEEQFYDVHGNLVYDVFSDDLKNRKLYKNYDEKNVKYIEVIQEPGEIMFVPSGWHHQVWNLEDTISINHNWINGCNINIMWLHLKTSLISIMKEVDDVKDMDDWPKHCQLLMEINHGMNYKQFYSFISFIAEKRLDFINDKIKATSFNKYQYGKNHCLFDLEMLKTVLEDFIIETTEKSINNFISTKDEPINLLEKIICVFEDKNV